MSSIVIPKNERTMPILEMVSIHNPNSRGIHINKFTKVEFGSVIKLERPGNITTQI